MTVETHILNAYDDDVQRVNDVVCIIITSSNWADTLRVAQLMALRYNIVDVYERPEVGNDVQIDWRTVGS